MRTNAAGGMDALFHAYSVESDGAVKMNMLSALAAVSGAPSLVVKPRGWNPSYHEELVLRHVRERYPHLFPAPLVPLGTNALAPGMLLHSPHGTNAPLGKVIAVDNSHEFYHDDFRPGVLLERDNLQTWVPRENLTRMLVGP